MPLSHACMTSFFGCLENTISRSPAGLLDIDTFHYITSKNQFRSPSTSFKKKGFKNQEAVKLMADILISFPKFCFSFESLNFYHWQSILSVIFHKVTASHFIFKKVSAKHPSLNNQSL